MNTRAPHDLTVRDVAGPGTWYKKRPAGSHIPDAAEYGSLSCVVHIWVAVAGRIFLLIFSIKFRYYNFTSKISTSSTQIDPTQRALALKKIKTRYKFYEIHEAH